LIKNILYLIGSFTLFFLGIIFYGIFLASSSESLESVLAKKGISEIKNPVIVVDKSEYNLALFSDTTLIKNYKVILGRVANKRIDIRSTPVGVFKICDKIEKYKYHKLLKLNYPNSGSGAELLMEKKISKSEYKRIANAELSDNCPPLDLQFIENFGLQGIGEYDLIFKNLPFVFNWTNGSVALSNKDIDEIFSVCKIGTQVTIRE
jgi:murein L,D-transpeptidase YafK